MKIPVQHIIEGEEIVIGFMPKKNVKDGLVIEHSAETASHLQPAMTHDLEVGRNRYPMPPIEPEFIKEVYLELEEEQ